MMHVPPLNFDPLDWSWIMSKDSPSFDMLSNLQHIYDIQWYPMISIIAPMIPMMPTLHHLLLRSRSEKNVEPSHMPVFSPRCQPWKCIEVIFAAVASIIWMFLRSIALIRFLESSQDMKETSKRNTVSLHVKRSRFTTHTFVYQISIKASATVTSCGCFQK